MSQSIVHPRFLLILVFATLWQLFSPAAGASASGEPPQCFDAGALTLEQGATFSFTAGQACLDPEGDPLTLIVTYPPDHGTLEGPNGSGLYTYTAPTDYVGPDSLSGKANDGTSDSNVATLSFEIIELVDDVPACFASLLGASPPVEGRFTVETGARLASSPQGRRIRAHARRRLPLATRTLAVLRTLRPSGEAREALARFESEYQRLYTLYAEAAAPGRQHTKALAAAIGSAEESVRARARAARLPACSP